MWDEITYVSLKPYKGWNLGMVMKFDLTLYNDAIIIRAWVKGKEGPRISTAIELNRRWH